MHTYLQLAQPYIFKLFIGLYFILYHFQLDTEKYDNFFNLKCQILQIIHNLYQICLMAGPFICPTKNYAIFHLVLVIITWLSWKCNPIKEYRNRCMITIIFNKMCGLPDKKGYKDLFWLFGIKNHKDSYAIYFLLMSIVNLYLIFGK
jgi:hypothetical protein